MTIIQLDMPGCGTCAMMSRMLGDRVEHALASDRPDLLALTNATSSPVFLVYEGDKYLGSFSGAMPLSVWEAKVQQRVKGEA